MKIKIKELKGNKEKVRRVVIYSRVSTDAQADNTSLAGQYELCKRRAAEMGALAVNVFEETQSGGLYLSRTQLQAALAVIEAKEADILMMARLDRTGRDVSALRDIKRRVEAAGGELVFADGVQFEKNAVGTLMFTQLSAFAEFEREVIRERTVAGLERTARAGRMPTRSRTPYAYHLWTNADCLRGDCTPDQVGTYSILDGESNWIPPIYERLAQGQSIRSIAKWLTEQGAPTRRGGAWNPITVYKIARNSIYKGEATWRKTRRVVDETRAERGMDIKQIVARPREEWVIIPAPPIVESELWGRANASLDEGRSARSGPSKGRYFLTGLLWCPLCGARMNSMAQISSRRLKDGSLKTYSGYTCRDRLEHIPGKPARCDLPRLTGVLLEQMVLSAIEVLFTAPQMLELAHNAWQDQVASSHDEAGDKRELGRLERQIATQLQRESIAADAAIRAIMNGGDGQSYEKARAESERARIGLQSQVATIAARARAASFELPSVEFDPASLEVLRSPEIAPDVRGGVLRLLTHTIYPVVLPDELRQSSKARRENRETALAPGKLGGVDIILEPAPEDGPFYVLSHRIVGWNESTDKWKRVCLRPQWETSLKIVRELEQPAKRGRASFADRADI